MLGKQGFFSMIALLWIEASLLEKHDSGISPTAVMLLLKWQLAKSVGISKKTATGQARALDEGCQTFRHTREDTQTVVSTSATKQKGTFAFHGRLDVCTPVVLTDCL